MMLKNSLYVNTDLTAAGIRSNDLSTADSQDWFYKKWSDGTSVPAVDAYVSADPDMRLAEDFVYQEMESLRAEYKTACETADQPYPASRPFTEQKELITASALFHIFRDMPKCGLLHVHNTVALSVEGFLDLLKAYKDSIYIITTKSPKTAGFLYGKLLLEKPGEPDDNYTTLKKFLSNGSNEIVLRNLLSFSSLSETEKIPYIWDEFNRIFLRTEALFANRQFYLEYHIKAFIEMIEDNIDYVELRCGFQDFLPPAPLQNHEFLGYRSEFLDVIEEACAAVQCKAYSILSRSFKVRVILNARRDLNTLNDPGYGKVAKKLDSAIIWKMLPQYSDLVLGFDLVSEEDRGCMTYSFFHKVFYGDIFSDYQLKPLSLPDFDDYLEQLHKLSGPRIQYIDFYLHDGESLWADNTNMLDAAIASYSRIGHGFGLAKFPALTDCLAGKAFLPRTEQDIPAGPVLEICPISNQMLRYFPDLRNHSAYELMKRGVQCVISSDDPQIMCNPGLSYDFWEAFVGLQLDMKAVKGLVFNAYACRKKADLAYADPTYTDLMRSDYKQIITYFNDIYWGPFILRANDYLKNL